MTTRLDDLEITKVALCAEGMNPEAEVLLFKAKPAEAPAPEEVGHMADTISKADLDAVTAERDALQAEIDALGSISNEDLAALRGIEIAKTEPTEDEVLKALPEDVRERIVKAEADAAANAERIAKMEQAERGRTFVALAKTAFPKVAEADKLGAALEVMERSAPAEAYNALTDCLKAANERIDMSTVLKEAGHSGSASDGAARLADAVAEIQKANPDLPRERAVAQALAADESLADEWQTATTK